MMIARKAARGNGCRFPHYAMLTGELMFGNEACEAAGWSWMVGHLRGRSSLERSRHCERSEAIHATVGRTMDCFAALAMTLEIQRSCRRFLLAYLREILTWVFDCKIRRVALALRPQ
jgi:hypothetical protein